MHNNKKIKKCFFTAQLISGSTWALALEIKGPIVLVDVWRFALEVIKVFPVSSGSLNNSWQAWELYLYWSNLKIVILHLFFWRHKVKG